MCYEKEENGNPRRTSITKPGKYQNSWRKRNFQISWNFGSGRHQTIRVEEKKNIWKKYSSKPSSASEILSKK